MWNSKIKFVHTVWNGNIYMETEIHFCVFLQCMWYSEKKTMYEIVGHRNTEVAVYFRQKIFHEFSG